MKSVAGIDVSKNKLDVFASGKWKVVSNDATGFRALGSFLKKQKVNLVVMEATGNYHEEVACTLCEAGFEVVVANPARTHYFAKSLGKRVKTDKVDAQMLAQFGEFQGDSQVRFTPPSPEMRRFKTLIRMRHDLVQTRAGAKARLKGKRLDELERKLLQAQVAFYKAQIQELDQQLRLIISQKASLARMEALLLSIPGVGTITAWTLIAEIGDFLRFTSAKQVAAFAGVCPSYRHSGSSLSGNGSLCRAGNRTIRKLLYLAAMAALREEGALRDYYERMIQSGKPKMVAVVALMHKILRVAYGVVTKGCPFIQERALTS